MTEIPITRAGRPATDEEIKATIDGEPLPALDFSPHGFGTCVLGCPYIHQANTMCNVLVNEVAEADTWARIDDAITAILRVRSRARNMIAEWEHLNNPSPNEGENTNNQNLVESPAQDSSEL